MISKINSAIKQNDLQQVKILVEIIIEEVSNMFEVPTSDFYPTHITYVCYEFITLKAKCNFYL